MSRPGRGLEPRRGLEPGRELEDGSAAVLVTVLAGFLVVAAVTGSVVGGLFVGHRRAAVAADLAALAAAETLVPDGVPSSAQVPACSEAARIGEANGARVTGCVVQGREVVVTAAVDVPNPLGGRWAVSGTARAGPVSPEAGSR